jgi:hypothetical protein
MRGVSAATNLLVEEGGAMNRLMVVARLKEGAHEEAERLLRQGPPFDAEDHGFHRHGAYLTAREVVFFFEAPEVEWIVNDIVDDPVMSDAFRAWEELIVDTPRLAHERFYWSREQDAVDMGLGV